MSTERTDPNPPPVEVDQTPAHHISGLYSYMVLDWLTERLSAEARRDTLVRAREIRSVDELADFSSWSSYDQFRRLLEESKRALGALTGPGPSGLASSKLIDTKIARSIRALGSPRNVLASATVENTLLPIRRYATTEVGQNEWTIAERFIEGFAAYPEFCEFTAGMYAMIPMYFGLPPAEILEETCQCFGDASCLFRLRWVQPDESTSRAEYLEVRTQLLEGHLRQLQEMVTDLASNERYEDVLQGIVGSALRTAAADGALLALEPRTGSPRRVYFEGISAPEAAALADDLLEGGASRSEVAFVEVRSARRHYGVLAIADRGGLSVPQSQDTLETYGRLAAAALDAADALEDARHQANTAQALLELSTSLAEIVSTEEMASKVARAVPDVIDCDRAAVFLNDETWHDAGESNFQLAASFGYPEGSANSINMRSYTGASANSVSENGIVGTFGSESGTAASISAPITVAGNTIGAVVAGVTSNPERLAITPHIADRLKGLAAQASIAISNAQLVDQIRFQAMHDTLTGLPNRALILDRTEQMLARARRSYFPVAALFIDLDGFKDVNDTLGHGVGDKLLEAVTARLAATIRESDSIGRLGGDEFVVLVDGTVMDAAPELVAERLLAVLREPFVLEGSSAYPLRLTASIGIAAGTRPSATELLRDADIALYQAKAAGRNCYVVFRPEMHRAVQDRRLFEMDLHDALGLEQYFLLFQPIFNLRSGGTTGVEALLRWRHPVRGIVQPDEFIPVLEDSGMIIDVGHWVLQEACRKGAQWHALGYRLDVSVNISTRQLETDQLVEDVRSTLNESGLDARSLIVEITETALMRNLPAIVPRLAALKETGVRIAIDDFGTGYSSLAYLQQFPVDSIKIDRSFISSMANSPESGALIRTLVQLGKNLGLETLAEGIEENEQYSRLDREHCDSGQGYLFARPLDADAVELFLADRTVMDATEYVRSEEIDA